jgi:hypothetical protein
MKKVLLFAAIFFILAIGIGWYIIYGRPAEDTPAADGGGLVSPFGGTSGNTNPANGTSTVTTTQPGSVQLAELTHIFNDPVSGAVIISSKTGTATAVRFTERATGHIFDTSLSSGATQRVSITTIPKIYESIWLPTGSTTIFRYLNDTTSTIQTYIAKLSKASASSTEGVTAVTQGTFLPENITSIAVNPSATKIFYITSSQTENKGSIAGIDGSKKTQIFSSAVSEWLARWPNDSTITLTTRPSSGVNGNLYFMDTAGNIRKIIGTTPGLTTLTNPQATLVATADSGLFFQIYDVKTGKSTPVAIRTLPEKCVWSTKQKNLIFCAVPTTLPGGAYPDGWYQGLVSFSDEIYRIDTNTGTASNIGALKATFKQDIDATNLSLSKAEDYLTFINKKDLSLWTMRMPQATGSTTPKR